MACFKINFNIIIIIIIIILKMILKQTGVNWLTV